MMSSCNGTETCLKLSVLQMHFILTKHIFPHVIEDKRETVMSAKNTTLSSAVLALHTNGIESSLEVVLLHNKCNTLFTWTKVTLTTRWVDWANDKLMAFFSYFPRKQHLTFYANCLQWKIYMKCQNLFSGKYKETNQYVVRWTSLA